MKLLIFYSTVRPKCMNIRVFELVKRLAEEMDFEVIAIDHDKYQREILSSPFYFYPDRSEAPKDLREINSLIESANAYLFTCAEYNKTIPPALTNMLDHFSPLAYAYKAAGMIGYTQGLDTTGTCLSHLRVLLSELGCLVIPDSLSITQVENLLDETGKPRAGQEEEYKIVVNSVKRILKQIAFVGEALIEQKKKAPMPQLHEYL